MLPAYLTSRAFYIFRFCFRRKAFIERKKEGSRWHYLQKYVVRLGWNHLLALENGNLHLPSIELPSTDMMPSEKQATNFQSSKTNGTVGCTTGNRVDLLFSEFSLKYCQQGNFLFTATKSGSQQRYPIIPNIQGQISKKHALLSVNFVCKNRSELGLLGTVYLFVSSRESVYPFRDPKGLGGCQKHAYRQFSVRRCIPSFEGFGAISLFHGVNEGYCLCAEPRIIGSKCARVHSVVFRAQKWSTASSTASDIITASNLDSNTVFEISAALIFRAGSDFFIDLNILGGVYAIFRRIQCTPSTWPAWEYQGLFPSKCSAAIIFWTMY